MKADFTSTTDGIRARLREAAPIAAALLRALAREGRDFAESTVHALAYGRGGSGRIVPELSVAGRALFTVVAIMSFLASLTVGAVSLVAGASSAWQADVGREVTIQIRPLAEVDAAAEAEKAASIARAIPGVASARALNDAENARLLEPWLGAELSVGDLPLPRLVVVALRDSASVDLGGLAARLRAEVRGASLDDHRSWMGRLRTMAGATVAVGIAVLAMVFAATALCIVFATRGAMVGNRDIVSVLHFVGAEDRFIVAEFQRHFMMLGLRGGLVGAAAAAVLFLLMGFVVALTTGTPETDQLGILFGRFNVGWGGYIGVFVAALAIAGLTALTSRYTVFRYLAEIE